VKGRARGSVLFIADDTALLPADLSRVRVLRRPKDVAAFSDEFLDQFEAILSEATAALELSEAPRAEPERLFSQREYRAAVISAVSLLESELAKRVDQDRPTHVRQLLKTAVGPEMVDPSDLAAVEEAILLRNAALHQNRRISQREARRAVSAIMSLVSRLP